MCCVGKKFNKNDVFFGKSVSKMFKFTRIKEKSKLRRKSIKAKFIAINGSIYCLFVVALH